MDEPNCDHPIEPVGADHAPLYELLISELTDFAVFLMDPEGCITSWNPGVKHILGYEQSEWVGRPFHIIFTLQDQVAGKPTQEMAKALSEGRAPDFRWHQKKDGSRFFVEGTIVALKDNGGRLLGFSKVMRDVTERKRIEQELRLKNEELIHANRGLEQFAHVASHDLQEPLRMVGSFSKLLISRLGSEVTEEQREFVGFIQRGVTMMEQLIHDLLVYSRTVHAVGEPVSQASLDEALSQAIAAVGSRIIETGATISRDQLPTVLGDLKQLSHVFQNLLSNALKYRKPHEPPQVHVSAFRQDAEWVISVSDNGIGFEACQSERIFGLFKRLHRDEEYPGTGLGLAICMYIVERYGGRMWAESKLGVGSVFFFALPVGTH